MFKKYVNKVVLKMVLSRLNVKVLSFILLQLWGEGGSPPGTVPCVTNETKVRPGEGQAGVRVLILTACLGLLARPCTVCPLSQRLEFSFACPIQQELHGRVLGDW